MSFIKKKKKLLNKFWFGIRTEFPAMSEKGLKLFLLSCTTSIWQETVSVFVTKKSKLQPTLKNVENALHSIIQLEFKIHVTVNKDIHLVSMQMLSSSVNGIVMYRYIYNK